MTMLNNMTPEQMLELLNSAVWDNDGSRYVLFVSDAELEGLKAGLASLSAQQAPVDVLEGLAKIVKLAVDDPSKASSPTTRFLWYREAKAALTAAGPFRKKETT